MQILMRKYRNEDFKPLTEIIRRTWHYDEFTDHETALKLARVFLSSCLTNYTFSRVAVIDGNVAGVILAKDIRIHKCSFSDRFRQIMSVARLFLSKESRRVSGIFKSVSGIDKELLSNCGKNYNAELALFAVDGAYQGKGAGKLLFDSAMDYMRKQQLSEFYLFTDTSYNYGFYEHCGMTRRCEEKHTFDINGTRADMNFFLYDLGLKDDPATC